MCSETAAAARAELLEFTERHDRMTARSWTFLTNHAYGLVLLYADSNSPLREVAARIGITERAVQRIVFELEESGFIQRERVGRKNRYRIFEGRPMGNPQRGNCKIGELLELTSDE